MENPLDIVSQKLEEATDEIERKVKIAVYREIAEVFEARAEELENKR